MLAPAFLRLGAMTTRILPRDEYHRLDPTLLAECARDLSERQGDVLVVEDGDQIVGCWALFPVLHVEGLWIAESHQKRTSVARRLWLGMKRLVKVRGGVKVATAACSDEVRALLAHVQATKLDGDHYVLSL